MSLIKQLWIGIILLLLLALGGSFVISFYSAKIYLEEQLNLKNIDNATSLALSISQMEKDPVTIELLITAQFDAGHYEYIIFKDTHSNPIVARNFDAALTPNVPSWFSKWIHFSPAPGIAAVQDGWQQYGTIIVMSHSGYAVDVLWKNATSLLKWFFIASLIGGLIGSNILRYISRPLDLVISQAEAIGERRFITSLEPRTLEFQRVVRAMNRLSNSVKAMLEKETRQLDLLRRESQIDALTGLANRMHFFNILDSKLNNDEENLEGVFVLIRVKNLIEINTRLGRQRTDDLLRNIAAALDQIAHQQNSSATGRLNGSDFALLLAGTIATELIAAEISQKINTQLDSDDYEDCVISTAIIRYRHGDTRANLLHNLDGGLAEAELKGNRACIILYGETRTSELKNIEHWRAAINQALHNEQLALGAFPVKSTSGELIHTDAPLRLEINSELKPAGYFIPWASRLGILPSIDLAVLKFALKDINQSAKALAINVSADSLCNANFREQALSMLSKHKDLAPLLWIDFPEVCALRHLDELRAFCNQLHHLGAHPGLEHLGLEFTEFQLLQDLGLSHLKIDRAIIHRIDENTENQPFLQGLCRIGHSLGLLVIAEGVVSKNEIETLNKLGIDGYTGPAIT